MNTVLACFFRLFEGERTIPSSLSLSRLLCLSRCRFSEADSFPFVRSFCPPKKLTSKFWGTSNVSGLEKAKGEGDVERLDLANCGEGSDCLKKGRGVENPGQEAAWASYSMNENTRAQPSQVYFILSHKAIEWGKKKDGIEVGSEEGMMNDVVEIRTAHQYLWEKRSYTPAQRAHDVGAFLILILVLFCRKFLFAWIAERMAIHATWERKCQFDADAARHAFENNVNWIGHVRASTTNKWWWLKLDSKEKEKDSNFHLCSLIPSLRIISTLLPFHFLLPNYLQTFIVERGNRLCMPYMSEPVYWLLFQLLRGRQNQEVRFRRFISVSRQVLLSGTSHPYRYNSIFPVLFFDIIPIVPHYPYSVGV